MGEKRNVYRLLVRKQEGKRSLRRPRCRWVDNIKMDLAKIGWSGVDCIGLAQDNSNNNSIKLFIIYVKSQQLQGQ
jgi:hypothetical protein